MQERFKDLHNTIVRRISDEERRRARVFLISSTAMGILSLCGIASSIYFVVQGLYQSSFYSYFSLLMSDPDASLLYWREFGLSLVETVPLLEITLSIVAVVMLLVSVRVFMQNLRSYQYGY